MKHDELDQLVDDLLDGACSEADFLRLEAELHVNLEARAAYYERLKLHTALQIESEDAAEESNIIELTNWRQRLPWIAAAALLLVGGVLGWKFGSAGNFAPLVATKPEPAAVGFGVLAEQSNAVWAHQRNFGRGDLLPAGMVRLESGIVQLDLFSGVTVILEGAAEFEIHSTMEMSVLFGRVRAIVPEPAHGFRVRTAKGDVVDLGTEFTIDVTDRHTELHVLDGEIEWHPLQKPVQRLVDGDSLRWSAQGERSAVASSADQFPGIVDLEDSQIERYEAWRAHSLKLRQDPRLLAYFPMDRQEDGHRMVDDVSGAGRDGTIVRAKRASDRWERQGQALDFSPMGSRVRMTIPGGHSALTLYCWVRIDSLDRWWNSLFLTDGHELSEPHWQIMADGRLFFSVKKLEKGSSERPDKHVFYSPPIWDTSMSGRWMQVASTYDTTTRRVTHYVDGKQISSEAVPDGYLVEQVKIGAASIGNWSEPYRSDPAFAVRNLNGAIDEFAIFSEALSAAEISQLYEIGKP
ncbi:MAG: hypothetical protein ACI8XO_002298 [Verrucomicrobiales bacterium]|jgi:hypothetical protein